MSISNDIRNVLDIQDKNIYISDNAVTYGIHKGKACKFKENNVQLMHPLIKEQA
ncbi:hypothetical protein ACFFIS_08275 [Virgibacillus soli]|uniref:Uncharacterized protein n=1 Tax=Paracerasibacillus soli TaxID=480284 RepID=A0ABU5CNH3_9BACI|nr:hypothetical protein [Virgibacillus soli]MDY0407904.1 hypothetical protein [Virgibacillus soli]